jgi:hypothetical protein
MRLYDIVQSPLEKHHIARTFSLFRSDDEYNFLKDFPSDSLNYFRRIVTETILATDLAKSMPWLAAARVAMVPALNQHSLSESNQPGHGSGPSISRRASILDVNKRKTSTSEKRGSTSTSSPPLLHLVPVDPKKQIVSIFCIESIFF